MENQKQLITANELVNLGYKPATAQKAIRTAKESLVKQGYKWYENKRLGLVPRKVVSEILGTEV